VEEAEAQRVIRPGLVRC